MLYFGGAIIVMCEISSISANKLCIVPIQAPPRGLTSYPYVKIYLYSFRIRMSGFHSYIRVVTVAVTGWLRPWSRSATKLTVYSSPGLRPVCTKEVMVLGSCAVIPPSLSWEKTQTEAMWWKETGTLLLIVCIFWVNVSVRKLLFSVEIRDLADKSLWSPVRHKQWLKQPISMQ